MSDKNITQPLMVNDDKSLFSSSTVTLSHSSQKNSQAIHEEAPKFKVYPMRWVILFFFAMMYPICNPIAPEVGEIFDKEATFVAMTATLFLFMHPVFTFPASYVIINYGLATSVKIGALLTIFGASVRCLCLISRQPDSHLITSFYWMLLGQTLSGIGRPFILNAQAQVAQNWFPISSRTQLVTLLNFMITCSGILGQVIPSIFFGGYKTAQDLPDFLDGRHRFRNLLWFEAGLVILFMVPLLFILRSNPPTPPSQFANQTQRVDFKGSMAKLFTDARFIGIFISFSLFFGTFKGFGVALPYLLLPFNYHSGDIALFASMPVVGGFISSLIVPMLYKRFLKYKPLIVLMQVFTIGTFYGLYFSCFTHKLWIVLIDTLFIGFFLIPSIPMTMEWACKQTFPVNDSFCIGIMYSGATLASSFIGQLITWVSKGNDATKYKFDNTVRQSSFHATILMTALQFIALVTILLIFEIRHKIQGSFATFHSVKAIKGKGKGTIMDEEDLFADFPHACPEGDPGFYFDVTPLDRVSEVDDEEIATQQDEIRKPSTDF